VDPFNDDRQVGDDVRQVSDVDLTAYAKSGESPEHRGAGGTLFVQQVEELLPQRVVRALRLVLLRDVDANTLADADDFHAPNPPTAPAVLTSHLATPRRARARCYRLHRARSSSKHLPPRARVPPTNSC